MYRSGLTFSMRSRPGGLGACEYATYAPWQTTNATRMRSTEVRDMRHTVAEAGRPATGLRAQLAHELTAVGHPFDRLDRLERAGHAVRLQNQLCAIGKFPMQLFARERPIRPAAVAIVRPLHERPPVHQIDFDDAADLLEALRLDGRVEHAGDALHDLLHRLARHEGVGEFEDARLAPQQDAAEQERNAELRLELGLGDLVAQRLQDVRAGLEPDRSEE